MSQTEGVGELPGPGQQKSPLRHPVSQPKRSELISPSWVPAGQPRAPPASQTPNAGGAWAARLAPALPAPPEPRAGAAGLFPAGTCRDSPSRAG